MDEVQKSVLELQKSFAKLDNAVFYKTKKEGPPHENWEKAFKDLKEALEKFGKVALP